MCVSLYNFGQKKIHHCFRSLKFQQIDHDMRMICNSQAKILMHDEVIASPKKKLYLWNIGSIPCMQSGQEFDPWSRYAKSISSIYWYWVRYKNYFSTCKHNIVFFPAEWIMCQICIHCRWYLHYLSHFTVYYWNCYSVKIQLLIAMQTWTWVNEGNILLS